MSNRRSALYTLCLFEVFPSRGNEKIGGTGYCVTYDTDSQSRNVLASPLGEEGHEVAKGWTVVIPIMILDVDVTAAGGIIISSPDRAIPQPSGQRPVKLKNLFPQPFYTTRRRQAAPLRPKGPSTFPSARPPKRPF